MHLTFAHLTYPKLDDLRCVGKPSLGKATRWGNNKELKDLGSLPKSLNITF